MADRPSPADLTSPAAPATGRGQYRCRWNA